MNVNTIIFNQVMKLAISITGRLYTLLEILPDLELNLLSKYDCDVFILVNTVDRKLYQKNKKKTFTKNIGLPEWGRKKIRKFPHDVNIESKIRQFLGNRLKFFKVIQTEYSLDLPKPRYPETSIKRIKIGRMEQFFKVFKVNEEIKKYQIQNNITYDYVIRTRSDLFINFKLDNFNLRKDSIHLFGCDFNLEMNRFKYTFDGFAIGNPNIMNVYSSLCFHYGDYTDHKYLTLSEGQLWQYLIDYQINIVFLKNTFLHFAGRDQIDNQAINYSINYGSFPSMSPHFKPINISQKYSFFPEKYSDQICKYFESEVNCSCEQKQDINGYNISIKRILNYDFCMDDIGLIIQDYSKLDYKLVSMDIIRHHCQKIKFVNDNISTDESNTYDFNKWSIDDSAICNSTNRFTPFKLIIYLSDVLEGENGGFQYFNPPKFSDQKGYKFQFKEKGIEVFGKKGTTIIYDSFMIHKNNLLHSRYRDTLNFTFIKV